MPQNPLKTVAGGRAVLGIVHTHRQLIGLGYRGLVLVGMLSVLTGLAQAAILILIVRVATALTADTQLISGTVGPISAVDLSVGQLIGAAFVALALLFLAELATSYAQANLTANAQRASQRYMVSRYSTASLPAQIKLPRGETAALLHGHPLQASSIAADLGVGLTALVNFVTLVVSAMVLSVQAGVVVLAGLGLMILALRPLMLVSRRLGGQRATEGRAMGALLVERLELTLELKVFGVDEIADRGLRKQIDRIARVTHRLRVVFRMTGASYRIAAYGMILAMMALINASDATNLAALTGSLLLLLRSLSYGQGVQNSFQAVSEKVEVVGQLAEEATRLEQEVESRPVEAAPQTAIGDISLTDVRFSYPGTEEVLRGISLDIAQGDFTAIVGPSGAGKSTVMRLLLRLYEPVAGEFTVHGVPIGSVDLASWRRRVGYVPQEAKLQSGTVAEAIRFHREWLSDDDVRLAASRAHIADEIERWPEGYATPVGQLGEGVSGGQRQRLALARALAGSPEVLLLDEPTSALDPISERLISETLDELRGEMTIIVIAHRLRTVERANRVILLRDGRVVEHEHNDLATLSQFLGDTS